MTAMIRLIRNDLSSGRMVDFCGWSKNDVEVPSRTASKAGRAAGCAGNQQCTADEKVQLTVLHRTSVSDLQTEWMPNQAAIMIG